MRRKMVENGMKTLKIFCRLAIFIQISSGIRKYENKVLSILFFSRKNSTTGKKRNLEQLFVLKIHCSRSTISSLYFADNLKKKKKIFKRQR